MKRVRYFLYRYKLVWIVLLCAMALLLFSASTTHAQVPACTGYYYTVRQGDNLFRIGYNNGLSTQQMWNANPQIAHPHWIYPNQVICVPTIPNVGPGGAEVILQPSPCRYYHTVAQGQTLAIIGGYYGVDQYAIAQSNNITNLDVIQIGRLLCIP